MKVHASFRRFASCPKMSLRYFLVCCVFTPCLVAGQITEYALLGQAVTLMPDIKTQPEEILWKHNKDMVVEFNGQTQQLYGSFEGRVTLDWHSAEITIVSLSFEDSGLYELQISAKNKLLETFQYTLEVIDRVAKPTISCKMNNGSSSDKSGRQATLTCSSDSQQSQPSLEFDWFSNGKRQIGPKLVIPLGDALDDQVYNCTVSNKLSEESATFTAKECYSNESILIPVIIGVVCVVVLISVIVFCVLKRKGRCARDEENQHNKTEDLENRGEERKVLLDRAPTFPSQQTLGHLAQKYNDPDPIQKDQLFNEMKQSLKQHSSSGPENQNPDLRTSTFPPVPEKPLRSLDLSSNEDQTNGVPTSGSEEDNISSFSHPVPEKPPRLHDLPNNDEDELGRSVEIKEKIECDPEDSEKTSDAVSGSENNETKRTSDPPTVPKKSELVKESVRKRKENADVNKPSEAVEEKPSESSPVVSTKPDSHKEEAAAKPEGDALPPVPKPHSRLSSKNTDVPVEDEQKQEVSADQAAGESGKDLPPTTPPHDQQSTETNPGEEILQGDKQVPEDKTPDGLSDQEKPDLPSSIPEEPQSLAISKPDNSNTDTVLESPDTELTVPDDKDKDKTKHDSENSPGKGDKAEAADDNNVNQS